MRIKGVRAELTLEGGRFTIEREGGPASAASSRTFTIEQVRGATVEVPSLTGRGWLHIAVVSGTPAPPGEMAAMSDPYALPITKRSAGACQKLAKMVVKHLQVRGVPKDTVNDEVRIPGGRILHGPLPDGVTPTPKATRTPDRPATTDAPAAAPAPHPDPAATPAPAPTPTPPAGGAELVGQLKELAELHQAGALSDEEFASAKARLLA